ncbi:MtnX-like HAD-IB family phosphatase [Pleurocapsales cyanobacterium LEGE 10410]|nr:MtnX-like HAD-IB family phosphatase [Pleurocapsales cyanobacterium LEGE 10410]
MKPSRVVFCDFDGTITTQDTFISVLEKFAPEVSAKLLPVIFRREITLKEGIRQTLGSISATCYPEIIEYIAEQPVRPGIREFLDFLNHREVPFVVISGGLTDMVEAVLKRQQLINSVTEIYAGEVDVTGKLLQVYSSLESDREFVAKAKAMENYPAQEKVAIGDSVTDINMSLAADLVFARDRLIEYLDTENKSYVRWQNFFDVRDYLAAHWQTTK